MSDPRDVEILARGQKWLETRCGVNEHSLLVRDLVAALTERQQATRVSVLEYVHNYWEFHSTNEEEFDEWMHTQIREAIAGTSGVLPNSRAEVEALRKERDGAIEQQKVASEQLEARLTVVREALETLTGQWRTVGKRLQRHIEPRFHPAGDQLLECADELSALRVDPSPQQTHVTSQPTKEQP